MEVVGGIVAKRGYYSLHRWSTGILFRPSLNPDGQDVPEDVTRAILISDALPKITSECWTAMQRLFIYCIERDPRTEAGTVDANNEVCVVFAANYTTGHVVVAAMPQVVGPAKVSMDRTRGACNLITGEYYPQWPPNGYAEIGDCHSHNRMGAFFSGVDDADDKGLPGMHLVCGAYQRDLTSGMWNYRIASSIVADKIRFEKKILVDDNSVITIEDMTYTDLAHIAFDKSISLHPNVLKHVHVNYPKDWKHEIVVRHPSVYEVPDWRKEKPKSWNNWSKQTQEDFEHWQRTGQWPDTPFDRMKAARGAEDPPRDEKSLIEEYYEEVFSKSEQKDLPGQTMLFDLGFDENGYFKGHEGMHPTLKEAFSDAFDEMDILIEEIRQMVGDETRFRALLAAYLNSLMIFKHVKYRRDSINRRTK